ncbi:hypothetical protein A3A76_03605 [Candidatus Woesebacteria bacterium RIFCSPLOWO2_01_FULL_39_23]|uniref:Glycosyl transferase family 1 domain-containing protein n=1 Tax=Candidatus Woesebacteria bacterium RIFCSPHIGHO2_01_FULL_40_22 TaxID=1802499 RepID=A0A1F7YK18_9BACT|nr:MAG: hypothetical protein A2628_02005 [Candidatus Woesebacteria bacterium RIFCSPHIGHO2_01_FULL_40_22]OGM36132.1 MAG: hypothetical protein A3E41_02245 [Candidatus Woesebacteria bacterium RIFCSPHIGHO2_12_FULL_38_9]OGM62714.1 MAG: hypothetical protein A3A76_03605 [Candidatus Woesebacteria bacterium RIFCSPLOWO2_01_FULL_39_23]
MKNLNFRRLIGIDGNEANISMRVGVHQYAYEILWGIYKLRNEWKDAYEFEVFLKNIPLDDLPEEIPGWKYRILKGEGLWIVKKLMPELIKSRKPDVFFSPNHYLPPFSLVPMVCVIHDLGYLKFSEQFKKRDFWQLKLWSAISINVSKYIIAVSNSTKKDIVRHYPFAINKTVVVHHGYDKSRFNLDIPNNDVRHILKRYKIDRSYIIFLSTLKPSKNLMGIIRAYKILKEQFSDHNLPLLVIAGKKGWLYDSIFQEVAQLNLEADIIFTDFIKESDKALLISGSELLISPSFWEGFGMHVLEAMACGIPVVISKMGSLPEVAGNAGIYVDPYDPEGIAGGIRKVLSLHDREYNILKKKLLLQSNKFSWEEAARKTLSVLTKAIS